MYGTREYRFSYTHEGETHYVTAPNMYWAFDIVRKRHGIDKVQDLKRAPFPKQKPLTTGHCQICGREIGTTTGNIAHHGYTRPGSGWQTASCFGAKWRPYEVACDALPPAIRGLQDYVEGCKVRLNDLMTNPPEQITYKSDDRFSKQKEYTFARPDNFDPKAELTHSDKYGGRNYANLFLAKVERLRTDIKYSQQDIVALKKRLADWIAPASREGQEKETVA